ncbi:MAG: beta-glucosidase [Acidimicrobiaceae bacterium]
MADIDELIKAMTLDEKASLTAGEDLWSTVAIERLGIPKVRVTDGPNGARGANLPGGGDATSVCVPCGSALGATWDVDLIERVGVLLGEETRRRGCRVLLAPTVNIHRSPLAGRNFECYSEDPFLSGSIAAAYIRGAQSRDVATTVKHYVGNDAEFERMSMSSVIDERTLREIYLLPFEMAVRDGGSLGVMTSYNRVNGSWCGEDPELFAILRDEWGFEGFVLSDWYAATSTDSARAGLDLEMPGPGRAFGGALADAVRSGELDESLLDDQVRRLLGVFDRLGALDDTGTELATSVDDPEDRALAREAAASAIVLLQNEGALPVDATAVRRVAVIGPNADRAVMMGGGSASLTPAYRATPLAALQEAFGDGVEVVYEQGVGIDRSVPTLAIALRLEFFAGTDLAEPGDVVHTADHPNTEVFFLGAPPGAPEPFSFRSTGAFEPPVTGRYVFSLVQAGRARLTVGGTVVIDGVSDPLPRDPNSYFGFGSEERVAEVHLEGGRPVDVLIEYSSEGTSGVYAVKVGCRAQVPMEAMTDAVAAAEGADIAIVVVGTTHEWESEGSDRQTMALPGQQEELIERVAAVNPNTIVVVNTGAPVSMPWADAVNAIVQLWFGGQEMAYALANVVTGDSDPGGRLPTTMPLQLEHNPSFGNFPGEYDEVRYGEGVFVGYRWYEARRLPVRFPFGHGLSYTSFEIGKPVLSSTTFPAGGTVEIDVTITNTGDRTGSEVVQCYVAPARSKVVRPMKELKAFTKVHLAAGATQKVTFTLTDRSFAHWDRGSGQRAALKKRLPFADMMAESKTRPPGWRVVPGDYVLHVGRSSADIAHTLQIAVHPPAS